MGRAGFVMASACAAVLIGSPAVVPQTAATDAQPGCGYWAVVDMAYLLGKPIPEDQRRALAAALGGGTASLLAVHDAAQGVGLHMVGVRAPLEELADAIRGPKVIHLEAPDHFAVLVRADAQWAHLVERGQSALVARAELNRRYSGHALILQSPDREDGPRLDLETFHHSFGAAAVGEHVRWAFELRNTGTGDLVLGQPGGG